ncbi:MAG: NAD-dependent epimerase/dehydratase family protein [Myxococcota bacterium]
MPSLNAPVAVTGGTGYVASWVIQELLSRGATVHATVRDPTKVERVAYLNEMADASAGTLVLYAADLLQDGAFADALQGCEIVIHTASPFLYGKIKDPQRQLVDPALKGTRNVLTQVNETESVRRVVLTSSVVAIYGDVGDCADRGGTLTEADWNETSSLDHNPYPYSKTVAEREAWKIAEAQDRWTLAVINPGFVMGPSLPPTRRDGASMKFMRDTIDGTLRFGTLDHQSGWVDVRDVAKAHVEAAVRDDAEGRHILSAQTASFYDAGQIIKAKLGDRVKVPPRTISKIGSYIAGPFNGFSMKYIARNVGHPLAFDNTRSKERLGIEYRPLAETLVEHATQILDN